MLYYLYDGSFTGLMSAVAHAVSGKTRPENIITMDSPRDNIFGDYISVNSDEQKSENMTETVTTIMGEEALSNILYCYLSEDAHSGIIIYNYIMFGLNAGRKTNMHLTDKAVLPLLNIVRKVKTEHHRMLGIVRFRLVENGLYYAAIDPDHNITGIIAPHFARRMSDQNWLIHDTRRKIAVVYNKKNWESVEIEISRAPEDTEGELFYSNLWKSYFKSIAISERKNLKLQKQFLPKRYWKNLTEMN